MKNINRIVIYICGIFLLNRSKKKSFYWYKKVIETNGEEL